MRIAFLMDPIANVLVDKDTTFALMLAAQARGHEVFTLGPMDLYAANGTAMAKLTPTKVQRADRPDHYSMGIPAVVDVAELDALWIRTDPPFDARYLYVTLLLELVRDKTLVVNDPRGLRDANEKLYQLHFPEVIPRTMVASREEEIRAFVRELGGTAIIKPLDGAGGRGVMILDESDKNLRSIIETLTDDGRRLAMVQQFLPAVREGDKRVLLLDGEPLGAILRVPRSDDARSNIHVGGSVVPAEIDSRDRRIVEAVAPRLKRDGLWFVGLDVIGGHLTEVNVTSPTGIQEMSRFAGVPLEDKVIAWTEARAAAVKSSRAAQ